MGGVQKNGPLLGPPNTRCRIILGTEKGTNSLTTTHIPYWDYCKVMVYVPNLRVHLVLKVGGHPPNPPNRPTPPVDPKSSRSASSS